MKITRDSLVLWVGLVSGVVAAIAANAGAFPANWTPTISTIGSIVAAISGWLKTSPLKGERDF